MENTSRNYQIAYLVATGCALQIAESIFPHPLPGVRLGLANIMTLLGLCMFGYTAGVKIAILRPLLASFMLGNFLTPGFMLSFSGSLLSFLTMMAVYWINVRIEKYAGFRLFSNIGISILGALSHSFVQLYIAYLLFVRHKGIFDFAPLFLVSGLITGWLTGYCVNYLMNRKESLDIYSSTSYPDLSLGSENRISFFIIAKIIVCIFLMLAVILVSNVRIMLYLAPVILAQGVIFKLSAKKFISQLRFLWILIFTSLIINIFFTPGETVFSFWILKISKQGLISGGVVGLRIMLLVYLSCIIVQETPWMALIKQLTKIKVSLRINNFLLLIPFSLTVYPLIWKRIENIKPKTLKNLLDNIL